MKARTRVKNLRFVFAIALFMSLGLLAFIVGLSYFVFYGPAEMHPPGTGGAFLGRTLGFATICLIIGFICERIVNKKILKPIIQLNQGMKNVAAGDFDSRLDHCSDILEIREMTANFNLMATELGSIETLRSDFVNNVSHEFKTPLTAIEGHAALLGDENLTPAQRLEHLNRITEGTRRLSRLTENILKISRLENQEYKLVPASYDLAEQLRIGIVLLEVEWAAKDLEWDIDLEEVRYFGEAELMLQVWLNLLGNAIKFTPVGGTISVKLARLENRIQVTVADTGPGIPPEALKHLFDKFYQADTSHSTEGNGLGLALAKRIIDLHHGEIHVASSLGVGAAFTVYLN